jgi:hypothetical protein
MTRKKAAHIEPSRHSTDQVDPFLDMVKKGVDEADGAGSPAIEPNTRPGGRRKAPVGASMTLNARIVGKVEYREGDGVSIAIRPGPCEVSVSARDATISWSQGDWHGSAALPIAIYRSYVSSKALQIEDTPRS